MVFTYCIVHLPLHYIRGGLLAMHVHLEELGLEVLGIAFMESYGHGAPVELLGIVGNR